MLHMGDSRVVLVADDEPALLRLITRLLERAGWQVVAVQESDAALGALGDADHPPAVALVDAGLPPHGAEPLLRAMIDGPDPPGVVLISGSRLSPDLEALLEACGGTFLGKPFVPDGLLAAIDAVAPD